MPRVHSVAAPCAPLAPLATLAAAFAALALAAGAASAMKLPTPHKTARLFPITHGAVWTFNVASAGAPARDEIWTVTRRCGTDATLSRAGTETKLKVLPNGVFGPGGAPWLADPISAGKSWTPRDGLTVRVTASYVDAATPAGRWSGCAVLTRTEIDAATRSGEELATTFCPEVGPVRLVLQPVAPAGPDPKPTTWDLRAYAKGKTDTSPDCTDPPATPPKPKP